MRLLALTAVLFLWACPNPKTGKIDPYMTARTVINQSQTAIALADGIFNQWKLGQKDAGKIKNAESIYQKVRAGVVGGLQLALNGVDIAQQAKTDPNVKVLLAQANDAWQNLRSSLYAVLTSGDSVDIVLTGSPPPESGSEDKSIGKSVSALKSGGKKNPVDQLPKKLPGS